MIITISIDSRDMAETVASEVSEVLSNLKDIEIVKNFAIRDLKNGVVVKNETFLESLEVVSNG